MIPSNELRIGNWVKSDGFTFTLNHVMGDEDFDPIPLTPEILEKCSSGRDIEKWVISYDFWLYDPLELDGVGSYSQRDTKIFAPMWKVQLLGFGLKYLHQLQNLYFALTGEELTYNPNQP